MERAELIGLEAPFEVQSKRGGRPSIITGFTANDPLGVGGGLFPDMPTVYFEGGGWLLLADLLDNFNLVKPKGVTS